MEVTDIKKMQKLPSFRTQLTLIITILVFVTIAVISALANSMINKEFEDYARRQQKNHGNRHGDGGNSRNALPLLRSGGKNL